MRQFEWLLGSCEEVWQLNLKDSLEASIAWCQLGAWLKDKGDIDLWSLTGANSSTGSEQTNFVVTARATGGGGGGGAPAVKCLQ